MGVKLFLLKTLSAHNSKASVHCKYKYIPDKYATETILIKKHNLFLSDFISLIMERSQGYNNFCLNSSA